MMRVSFVTCFRDAEKYERCRISIAQLSRAPGVAIDVVACDNRAGLESSPQALNRGRGVARGDIIVFCHEDVVFPPRWLVSLQDTLVQLENRSPRWAVLGPMGRQAKRFLGHALDGDGQAAYYGPLPAIVDTLDEFCLIVPASCPLRFDEQLGGHHLYGADLCIQAQEASLGCYAGDLPCAHHSRTRHRPPDYHVIKRRLQRKWMFRRRRVGRLIGTTCGRIRFGVFEGWI